jgi:RHS repeat-associated protein
VCNSFFLVHGMQNLSSFSQGQPRFSNGFLGVYHSPFGVELKGRNFSKTGSSEKFRFGYQGSEKDDEVKGEGNSYTTFFRQLDPRLGMWFSIDPVTQPWQSTYCSMNNNPIKNNDFRGDEVPITSTNKSDRKAFCKLLHDITGGSYRINKKGELKARFGMYGRGEAARQTKAVITSKESFPLEIVNKDPNVFFDSYLTTAVDIDDLKKNIDIAKAIFSHIMTERSAAGANYKDFASRKKAFTSASFFGGVALDSEFGAHHSDALRSESKAMAEVIGVTSLPDRTEGLADEQIDNPDGTKTLVITGFLFLYGDAVIYSIEFANPHVMDGVKSIPDMNSPDFYLRNITKITKVK